jgi:hypothetical protein
VLHTWCLESVYSPSRTVLVQISAEAIKIHLEEEDSLDLDLLVDDCLDDFPEADAGDVFGERAAAIAKCSITEQTRSGHVR